METPSASSILMSLVCVIIITGVVKVVNWLWLRPKKLERWLKQQGLQGTPYKVLFGDLNDSSSMRSQAIVKPMNGFSHDYIPRIDPLFNHLMTKFGKEFFMWSGTTPMVTISKPELIREVLKKIQVFRKPYEHAIIDEIFSGFANYKGEQWAQHRKMINPVFHTEKLKLMMPAFYESCDELIQRLEKLI